MGEMVVKQTIFSFVCLKQLEVVVWYIFEQGDTKDGGKKDKGGK